MTYQVKAQPDGKYWCIEVPAIGRAIMATSVREIETMAKDLIEIMTGEQNPAIAVEYINLPDEVGESIKLKAEAERVEAEARDKQRQAVVSLHDMGMPFREIGAILGISYQRAHQLANA